MTYIAARLETLRSYVLVGVLALVAAAGALADDALKPCTDGQ